MHTNAARLTRFEVNDKADDQAGIEVVAITTSLYESIRIALSVHLDPLVAIDLIVSLC